MRIEKQINIKIDKTPLEKYIKNKWKKFLLCTIFRNKTYYVHLDFGCYCIGLFDGFDGDKAKLKVSDRGFITSPINEFFLKQQPNMIHLHKKLKTLK